MSDTVLHAALSVLAPVVRLLIRRGIDYPRFAAAMKRVFVEEALRESKRTGQGATHTAISLLSGLQRRDVKLLRESPTSFVPAKATAPTLAMQVVAKWTSDPRFLDEREEPRRLLIKSSSELEPSFEKLADEISKDVHAPALLEELIRLRLAEVEGAYTRLVATEFVAPPGSEQLLGAMARNTRDHLEASIANVLGADPRFLEYSLVADELRPDSVQHLQELARKYWRTMYRRMVVATTERVEADKPRGFADAPEMRMRLGVFFFAEPVKSDAPSADGDFGNAASDERRVLSPESKDGEEHQR